MKKKYTMEEFEKMFDDAEAAALNKMDKDFENAIKGSEKEFDSMNKFTFTMQNVMAIVELKKQLFKTEEED